MRTIKAGLRGIAAFSMLFGWLTPAASLQTAAALNNNDLALMSAVAPISSATTASYKPQATQAIQSIQAAPVIDSFDDGAPIGDGGWEMTVCGTDLISATQLLFNGKYPAFLHQFDGSCWYTAVPIVEPPDAVNGPLVIIAPNGVATSTTNFTAEPFNDESLENVEYRHIWLPDGKFFAVTGPYFGTATEVLLDNVPVSFRSASSLRLLIPVSDFDTLTHSLAITTPYGSVYTNTASFKDFMVTNMILPDSPGSFELTKFEAGASPRDSNNSYIDLNGTLSSGNDFVSSDYTYVDTGNDKPAAYLHQTSIVVSPTLIGPNRVFASGTLTSAATDRAIQWSVVGTIQPYSQEYSLTTIFTDTAGLGPLKLRTRLDEDVWAPENDMMAMVGTPGQPDFVIMTPDDQLRVGFGLKGIYTTTAGLLENAAWDGFAAGYYNDLSRWILDHSLHYEKTPIPGAYITGTTANIDLATNAVSDEHCAAQQAEAGWYSGYVYLTQAADCDMGVTMSWTADPSATTAKITHILLNMAADPTRSAVASLGGMDATVADQSLTFAPAPFVSSTLIYTDATPRVGTSVILTPTLNDAQSLVSVVQVTAPGASAPVACTLTLFTCPLALGVNRIDVVVLSANAQQSKTYSFYITRVAEVNASSDANLLNLAIDPGTLAPAFVSTTTSYTAGVPNGTTQVLVTATTSDVSATVAYATSAGGCQGTYCSVAGPKTWITVTVTAADAATTAEYYIEITVADATVSNDASLLNLAIDPGTPAPAFVSTTTSYTAGVPNGTTQVEVMATASDVSATVAYASSAGGCQGTYCSVAGPKTWITVTVTAADAATTAEYYIEITVADANASTDALLLNLAIDPGTLAPAFVSSTNAYAAGVPNGTTSAAVTATPSDANATVTYESSAGACVLPQSARGTDVPSWSCAVAGPKTWITVTVTAADGVTTEKYSIEITVAAPLTTIDRVWPGTGLPEGGMPVQIFGTGFVAALTVTVDGVSVPFTRTNDGQIDFVMPPGTAGQSVDVVVFTADGSVTAVNAFTYVQPTVIEFEGEIGGVFTTTDGVVVTIPPQGITGTFFLTMTPLPPAPGVPGNILMYSFRLDAVLNGLKLETLTNPVTIKLPIDENIFAIADGERPWLYSWTADGRRLTAAETTAVGGQRSAVGGRWVLVRSQEYDASTYVMTVALRPMGLYALSTAYVREYWFPVVPVLR